VSAAILQISSKNFAYSNLPYRGNAAMLASPWHQINIQVKNFKTKMHDVQVSGISIIA
jgi:hypothetical protein